VPIDPEKDVTLDRDTGTATVSVPEGTLKDWIEQAVAVAEGAGSREPALEIRIDTPPADESTAEPVEVKEVRVEIPIDDLRAVAESPVENVKIVSDVGEVTLNTDAIEDLIARTETEAENAPTVDLVVVKGEEKLEETLTEEQKEAVRGEGIREVFDVSVYAGGKSIEDFETPTGKLTIGLPYKLKDGETGEGVGVLHVKKDGNTEPMIDGSYDEKKELAVFQTNHLSVYAVVYNKEAEKPEEPIEDAKRGGGCDAGAWGAAGWLAFWAFLTAGVSKKSKRK
jgi:hypothetical protein